jgi:hypothetical protein
MNAFDRFILWVLKPKGREAPPGVYQASVTKTYHPDGPDVQIRFKFFALDADESPIGQFIVNTSSDTIFEIDGQTVTGSQALESLRQAHRFHVRITVEKTGILSRLSYETQ